MKIFQWEIWWARLPVGYGAHIEIGLRPVLVVSGRYANAYAPTINVVPLSTNLQTSGLRTRVILSGHNMKRQSLAFCEQLLTLDKTCLVERCGFLWSKEERELVRKAISAQLDLYFMPREHHYHNTTNPITNDYEAKESEDEAE